MEHPLIIPQNQPTPSGPIITQPEAPIILRPGDDLIILSAEFARDVTSATRIARVTNGPYRKSCKRLGFCFPLAWNRDTRAGVMPLIFMQYWELVKQAYLGLRCDSPWVEKDKDSHG